MHREILQIESAGRIGRLCGAASGLPAKSIVDIRVAVAYFVIVSMAGFLFGGAVPVDAREGDAQDVPVCLRLFSPFDSDDRRSIRAVRLRAHDGYGAYRRGHLHSGLDLVGKPNERVYAVGKGKVVGFVGEFPNRAVLVRHRLKNGDVFYSGYFHVADMRVQPGDIVDETTCIGRLFDAEEQRRSRFPVRHTHLEIRKRIDDDGKKSYTSKTMEELDRYFHDPMRFLKQHLR